MPPEIKSDSPDATLSRRLLGRIGPIRRQLPQVFRLAWRAWPAGTILIPILTITAGILPALALYFLKKVIDGVALWSGGDILNGRPMVILFVSLAIGTLLVQQGLILLLHFAQTVLESKLRFVIQDQILQKATELDQSFFDTPSFYDKLQRAQREVGFRPFSILIALVQGTRETITLIGFLAVITTLAWWIAPCLVVAALPGLFVQSRFGWQGWRIVSGRTGRERQMSYLQTLLTSNRESKEIRLLGLGQHLAKRWRDMFMEFYRQDIRLAGRRVTAEFGAVLVETIAYAGFYSYAIYCTVSNPHVTLGSLIMYTQAMERATFSVNTIMQSVATFYENNLYLNNLFEYLRQKPLLIPSPASKSVPQPIREGIRFENVTFRYPGTTADVLKNISMEIPAQGRVALVGENGAGKTTLIKLLARLYDPQYGRITVDGIDLRELDPVQWQRRLGVIFQDFARYYLTARENVGFGDLEHVDDLPRIRAAAQLSGAAEFIEGLDRKWETVLGNMFEDSRELSLGEWQKVALARAFMRESSLLVLDEPTASLDAKQEYEIFRRFEELASGKTTVLISHRFSSVRMADHIFVLEDGSLVEQGRHEELLILGRRYAEMYKRQAGAYR